MDTVANKIAFSYEIFSVGSDVSHFFNGFRIMVKMFTIQEIILPLLELI